MIQNFAELIKVAQDGPAAKMAVAVAEDEDVLLALDAAQQRGIVDAILVGHQEKIELVAKTAGINLAPYQIIHEENNLQAARRAVQLVSSGNAQLVMKGLIGTADILRAVLDKEVGLRTGRVLSHVAVVDVQGFDHLMLVTDAAMNIAPDLSQKVQIIQNAVLVARALGIDMPKVAPLAAVEVVNPDMPATVEAAQLSKMAERGQIKNCIIDGPLALDNAVSAEAAAHKGIKSPVAGLADILLVPDIEAGNILYKSLTYFARAQMGGMIAGAKAPVVLTSRADSPATKLNSIALGVVAAHGHK